MERRPEDTTWSDGPGPEASRFRPVARWVAIAAAVVFIVAFGIDTDGDPQPSREPAMTFEEQAEVIDRYLTGLRDGDLERAWAVVCHEGVLSADRQDFMAHHRQGLPKPVSWEVFDTSGSSSVGFKGSRGTSWPRVEVRFEGGLEGRVSMGRMHGALCMVAASDEHKVARHRLDMSP